MCHSQFKKKYWPTNIVFLKFPIVFNLLFLVFFSDISSPMSYMNYGPLYGGMCENPPALPPRNPNVPTPPYGSPAMSGNIIPGQAPRLVINESEAVALLQHLDRDELRALLENENKLDELVQDLMQVKNIQQDREMMLASNKSLAEYNLEIRPRFEELKQTIAKNYAEISQLKTKLAEDIGNLDVILNNQSLETILALIQADAATTEEESEKLADDFLDKKSETEQFLEEYIPKRTEAHLKRVKTEKMSDLIQNRNLSTPPMSDLHHSSFHWKESSSGHCPYPSANSAGSFMRMPDPSHYM